MEPTMTDAFTGLTRDQQIAAMRSEAVRLDDPPLTEAEAARIVDAYDAQQARSTELPDGQAALSHRDSYAAAPPPLHPIGNGKNSSPRLAAALADPARVARDLRRAAAHRDREAG
jgi:hypothetical protein